MTAWMSSNFGKIPHKLRSKLPRACEKSMYNVVNTLAPSFFIKSSPFMQVRRTTKLSRTSSQFSTIRPDSA